MNTPPRVPLKPPPPAVSAHEATKLVTRTHLGQVAQTEEKLKVRVYATTPAEVTVAMGRTINLDNYEFARVDVRVMVPCYVEEIPEVYQETKDLVADLVGTEVDAIMDSLKSGV